jgi:4-amino-4-deoxy-L-arabinose transferase-like glycosyltransferase
MIPYLQRSVQKNQSTQLLYVFLGLWFLVNLMQAALTGLHPDEAYYWIYSKFLDWGYFDHPPMVALYIKAGDTLIHNPLGLRLVTLVTNTFSILVLWQIVKPYAKNLPLFLLLFSSVLIFHVYGFITTPDSPLYFFSILFLYAYQQYVKANKLVWAMALGVLAAALLLSKYHGILVIFFILLSNFRLFTRPSFWLAMLIAFALFAPHIYWQFINGFPSVKYHLFERSASPYKFEYTAQYFLDQLLMMGPLMGWFLFYSAWKQESKGDLFLRGLKFLVYGVLIFFFLNTFKGRVQAHWPLIEFIPLFILAYIFIAKTGLSNTYRKIFLLNVCLIMIYCFLPPLLHCKN